MLQPNLNSQSSFHVSRQGVEGFGQPPIVVKALQAYLGGHYASLENDLAGLSPRPNLSPEIQSQLYHDILEAFHKSLSQTPKIAINSLTNVTVLQTETTVQQDTSPFAENTAPGSSQKDVGADTDMGNESRLEEQNVQSHSQQVSAPASAQAPENVEPTSAQIPMPVSPRKRSRDMIEDIPNHRACGREPGQCKAVKIRAHEDVKEHMRKTRTQGDAEDGKEQARKARVEQLRDWHKGCAKSAPERRQEYQAWVLLNKKLTARTEKFTDQEPSTKYEVMGPTEEGILCGRLTNIECKRPLPASEIKIVRRMFDYPGSQNEVTTSGVEIARRIFVSPDGRNAVTVGLNSSPDPATQTSSVTEPTQDMDGIQENGVAPTQVLALVSPIQEGTAMEEVQIVPPSPDVSNLASPRTPDSTFSDSRNGYSTEDTEMSGDEGQVRFGSGSTQPMLNVLPTTTVPAMNISQALNIIQEVNDPKMTDAPRVQVGLLSNTSTALVGDATMDDIHDEVSLVEPVRSSDTSMQEAQATPEQVNVFHSAGTPFNTQMGASADQPLQMADLLTANATGQSTSSEDLMQTSHMQPQSATTIAAGAPTRGVKRPAEDPTQVVTSYSGKKRRTASPRKTPQTPTSPPPALVQSPSLTTSQVPFQTMQLFEFIETNAETVAKGFVAESDEGYRSHLRMVLRGFTIEHSGLADQVKNDILVLVDEKYPLHHGLVVGPQMWGQKQEVPDVVQQHFECLEATAIDAVKNEDGLVDTDEGYQEALRSNTKSAIENSTASAQLKDDLRFLLYKKYPLRFEGATDMMTYPQMQEGLPEPPNVYDDPLGYAEWVLEWRPLLIPETHKTLVKMLVSEAARINPSSKWLEAMGTPSHLVGSLQDGLLMDHPNYKLRGQAASSEDYLCWEYRELHPRTRLELKEELLDIAKYNPEEYGRVLQCAFDMDLHPADCFHDENRSGLSSEAYDKAMDFVPALDNVRLDDFFAKTHCAATLTEKQMEALPVDVSGDAYDLVDRLKQLGSLDILQEATEQFFARGDFAERRTIFRQALRRAGLCTSIGNYAFREFQAWLKRIELGPPESESETEAGAQDAMKDGMNDIEKAKAKAEADDRAEAEAQIVIELETALQEILKLRYPRTQKFGAAQALRPPLRETAEQKHEPAIRKGDAPKSSKGAIWKR